MSRATRLNARVGAADATIFTDGARFGATLMSLGDSLSANGGADSNGVGRAGDVNPLVVALAMNGGSIVYVGAAATPGYTTAQILSTHLSTVLAKRPGVCVVLGGTNDVASVAFATTKANLVSMWTQLRDAGIRVVACTIPPQTGASTATRLKISQLNQWIVRYCAANRIPVFDYFAALVNPGATGTAGDYISGYSGDGIHPNNIGANAAGATILPKLAAVLGQVGGAPPFATFNGGAAATGLAVNNPLVLANTVVAGQPDSWSKQGSTTVTSTVADTSGSANGPAGMWKLTKGATAAGETYSSASVACTPGDRWALGFKFDAAAASGAWAITMYNPAPNVRLAGFSCITAFPAGSGWFQEFVIPAGCTSMQPRIELPTAATTLRIGQFTWLNLTALGF